MRFSVRAFSLVPVSGSKISTTIFFSVKNRTKNLDSIAKMLGELGK